MVPHFLRCQGLAVVYYGVALGRLGPGASSAFAQLRYDKSDMGNQTLTEACDYYYLIDGNATVPQFFIYQNLFKHAIEFR